MSAPASSASSICLIFFSLDLNPERVRRVFAHGVDSLFNAAGGNDMIVLDQDAVGKPETVVFAAAAADGVFLKDAQAGQCFARIHDLRMIAADISDDLVRFRGDPG